MKAKVIFFPLHPDLFRSVTGEELIDLLLVKMLNSGQSELPWGYIVCQERPHEWQTVETGTDNTDILFIHPHLRIGQSLNAKPHGLIENTALVALEKCLLKIGKVHGRITHLDIDERSEWLNERKAQLLHRVNRDSFLECLAV